MAGRKSTVQTHPLAGDIETLVRSRWSAVAIRQFLTRMHPEQADSLPSEKAIQRYRANLEKKGDAGLIPVGKLAEKLQQIDVRVDLYTDLHKLVYLLGQRVVGALEFEEGIGNIPVGATDKAVESYLRAIQELREHGQAIGEIPVAPVRVEGDLGLSARSPLSEAARTAAYKVQYEHSTGRKAPQFGEHRRRRKRKAK